MKEKLVKLNNWFIGYLMVPGGDIQGLKGEVYNHPNFEDGKIIMPGTPIEYDAKKRIVTSYSGRKYVLGSFRNSVHNIMGEDESIDWLQNHLVKKS